MNPVRFEIPYPPSKKGRAAWNKRFSLNAYWAGKNYRERARDAREIHALVILALKKARIRKQPFREPVEIVFRWDDGLDVDNHGALGKMISDAIKGWVIQDDSPRWVRRVVHEFWEEGKIGVEVREETQEQETLWEGKR